MEAWTLVVVLMFQQAPRAVTSLPGYSKDRCELAAYTVTTSAMANRKLDVVAWCIPGPGK